METKENNSGNLCEFNWVQDILLIDKVTELCNYWSNQIDRLTVFVKSSYQRDLCLASLVNGRNGDILITYTTNYKRL